MYCFKFFCGVLLCIFFSFFSFLFLSLSVFLLLSCYLANKDSYIHTDRNNHYTFRLAIPVIVIS